MDVVYHQRSDRLVSAGFNTPASGVDGFRGKLAAVLRKHCVVLSRVPTHVGRCL